MNASRLQPRVYIVAHYVHNFGLSLHYASSSMNSIHRVYLEEYYKLISAKFSLTSETRIATPSLTQHEQAIKERGLRE